MVQRYPYVHEHFVILQIDLTTSCIFWYLVCVLCYIVLCCFPQTSSVVGATGHRCAGKHVTFVMK